MSFKKIKYYILILPMFLFSFYSVALAEGIKERLKGAGGGAEYAEIEGSGEFYFAERIGSLIQVILSFLGVIFVILVIYGGFMWMTARGNEQQVEKARKVLTDSIIGIVIIMLAYAITWFVVSKLGEATEFTTGL